MDGSFVSKFVREHNATESKELIEQITDNIKYVHQSSENNFLVVSASGDNFFDARNALRNNSLNISFDLLTTERIADLVAGYSCVPTILSHEDAFPNKEIVVDMSLLGISGRYAKKHLGGSGEPLFYLVKSNSLPTFCSERDDSGLMTHGEHSTNKENVRKVLYDLARQNNNDVLFLHPENEKNAHSVFKYAVPSVDLGKFFFGNQAEKLERMIDVELDVSITQALHALFEECWYINFIDRPLHVINMPGQLRGGFKISSKSARDIYKETRTVFGYTYLD